MAYSKKAQQKYNSQSIIFTVKYNKNDLEYGKKLQEYLFASGRTANEYLKDIIKKDLDNRKNNS